MMEKKQGKFAITYIFHCDIFSIFFSVPYSISLFHRSCIY
jgi:hypothetical protein